MKIALVGPGIMPIPPPGWGAVEILIWDYYTELTRLGHEVQIINVIRNTPHDQSNPNTPYCKQLITMINAEHYDFVHIHYDCLYHIMPFLSCKKIAITSHYPYIDQLHKHHPDGYANAFRNICNNDNHFIFALSKKDYAMFRKFASNANQIFLMLNGANHHEITPLQGTGIHSNKSIYIGKIEERKQQHKYCVLPNIDFYGKCDDFYFKQKGCYKGEPIRRELIDSLVSYGNLVLLSNGENGTPLVIKEALMAGLPIITNKYSADDLDISLPFIDIIPDEKLDDMEYIATIIQTNLQKQDYKNNIRDYAYNNFSWENLIKKYSDVISTL